MSTLDRSLAIGAVAFAVALASPPASLAAQPEALTPTACAVEPRSDADVAGLAAATSAPLPDATPSTGDRKDGLIGRFHGEPADPETAAEVGNALAEYAGCLSASDRPRLLALLTDRFAAEVSAAWEARAADSGATPAAGSGAPPLLVAAQFEGWDAPHLTIASLRARDILLLPDGRAVADAAWRLSGDGDDTYRKAELVVLDRVGDRWQVDDASGGWLVEGEVIIVPPDESYDEIPDAPGGYSEVDSAACAEPTMAGYEFAIAATLMAASDATGGGVGCEFIAIERSVRSVTGSASCRADEGRVDLPSYLVVEVYDSRRPGDGPALRCEDAAPLAAYVTCACNAERPDALP